MKISRIFSTEKSNENGSDTLPDREKRNHFSLFNGTEIFELIKEKINAAEKSIFVAAAWFTDQELFDVLVNKYSTSVGIDIQIILDDNKENFFLPFKKLVDKGGMVRLIKKSEAFGRMHNKFCIIDESEVISGSYNWSKNARTNNEENIIYTRDRDTVEEFISTFKSLLEQSVQFDPENLNEIDEETPDESELGKVDESTNDYEKLITELIYAQVHSYDDRKLYDIGKERSRNCAGDAGNLEHELDNVYATFLRDIKISNDKKEIIKSSLTEQLERSKGRTDLTLENENNQVEKQTDISITQIDQKAKTLSAELNSKTAEVENLKSNEESSINSQLEQLNKEVEKEESDNYRPKMPWYKFIPSLLFLFFVIVYSIIFYSSAAYILIYSQDDAKEAQLNGVMTGSAEIFDGEAISKALERGSVALMFIILTPFFILGLIYFLNTIKNKWQKYLGLVAAILFIDLFTAYKVAEAIHKTEYIKGQTDIAWEAGMVWSNTDFYLVLVFGFMALLTFELLLGFVFGILDGRNEDIVFKKSRERVKNIKFRIEELQAKLLEVKNDININEAELKNLHQEITGLEAEKSKLISMMESKKHSNQEKADYQKSAFENITKINLAKIENENFTFSTIYVDDRISIFIGGWKDYLHEHFANKIAVQMSMEANEAINQWKKENLNNSKKYTA